MLSWLPTKEILRKKYVVHKTLYSDYIGCKECRIRKIRSTTKLATVEGLLMLTTKVYKGRCYMDVLLIVEWVVLKIIVPKRVLG